MKNKGSIGLWLRISFLWGCLAGIPANGAAQNLIPEPMRVDSQPGTFWLSSRTAIVSPDFPDLIDYLNYHIEKGYGYRLADTLNGIDQASRIDIREDRNLPTEGYLLRITPTEITIRGGSRAGAFYGLQTFFQLLTPGVYGPTDSLPQREPVPLGCLAIEDAPRYPYRGVMLDVSRTFFDKATVMRYIDWLSRHKINKLHWHLTDDDGWRIEIKQYPDLTQKGAWRGPGEVIPASYGSGEKRYGGFYTQDEVREIVQYAAFRNIEIIPEIDLPGHSRAARATYPQIFCDPPEKPAPELMRNIWCTGKEENYEMLRNIFHELAELFPSPYIHIGGDEVSLRYWRTCPHCKAVMRKEGFKQVSELQGYFMGRLEEIIRAEGKRCGAWNEVIHSQSDTTMLIYGWEDTEVCQEALEKGYPLVAMPASYLYIDMRQGPHDRGHTWAWLVDTRRVYSFEPETLAASPDQARLIRGIEGAQWAELLGFPSRFLEYQGYPRICALAEVGWSQPDRRNWEDFYRRLTESHLDRLAAMGIAFRMFPPEVTYQNGTITASPSLPGATLEYTTDPDEATAEYRPYTAPIVDTMPEKYLFRSCYRGGYSPGVPAMSYRQTIRLAPNETRTIQLPLDEMVDRNGIWYLSVVPEYENTRINQLSVNGPDTTYSIIRNGQMANPFSNLRIYVDDRNRTATATLILSNRNKVENRITLGMRPSPFLEPPLVVSSSMPFDLRFPTRGITDYNLSTYTRTRRTCRTGDYILYTFDEPVECSSIEIQTGLSNLTRYIVTQGTVDYSGDGTAYTHGGRLDDRGRFMLYPKYPVKSIRIRIESGNGEPHIAIQDLKIRR